MTRRFHYGRLMHKALRGLMAEVLADVAENGLPGAHHFFITFDTTHPGVDIPDYLRQRYPDEMTIVIQDWFADLVVTPDRFAVTLNFAEVPEKLVIPFDAIQTFVDPSVEFGLRFDAGEEPEDADEDEDFAEFDDDEPEPQRADGHDAAAASADDEDDRKTGDVVSLDQFRKH
ncbi:SspB family protein [Halovulum sp. GXIMD14794]